MAKDLFSKDNPVPRDAISQIQDEEDFIQFLRGELDWPIPLHIDRLEDVAIPHDLQKDFGFAPEEDRIQVSRLLNLSEDQPWGIFLFEFKTKRPYLAHLRRLLRVLGSQRTLRRGDPIWDRNDILFICTNDWRSYQFVHFSGERAESALISSFGWKGPEDRFLYTLCKHNLPKLHMPEPDATGEFDPDDWRTYWREAFNIKPVTDEFYATLKEVFQAVQSGVSGLKGEQRRAFTELLVNRLIFLKFVEKKGWLDNDPDYLYNQFKQYGSKRFWKDFLFYLFFEGMNTDPDQRSPEAQRILGQVPYLNAELFALSTDWDDRQVDVSNGSLNLLFDKLLNPYNFTISETSPLEVEVAFNQDLLGYAYEELIADQHGQGAYYTHPTEVNLMCRESLRAYLETRCPQVDQEQIGLLVYGEISLIGDQSPIPPEHAIVLYTALHDVTICDPAVGSGTFPVAMVKHIFTIMRTLGQILADYGPFQDLIDRESLTDWRKGYELKLHIIERSIYGCDIDYFAVQIAKLRFWVELMVECDEPSPLPNFDFKLLVGDALVSVIGFDGKKNPLALEELVGHPTSPKGQIGFNSELIRHYGNLKKHYYNAKSVAERSLKHREIIQARSILLEETARFSRPIEQRIHNHILWQVDYAEIFQGAKPGFDIIIANPPYLRQELIDIAFKEFKLAISKDYLREIYKDLMNIKVRGTADLYVYFYLRSLALAKQKGGIICFICSNSWLDVEYGEELQKAILDNTIKFKIFDSKVARSFETAAINTAITLFLTGRSNLDGEQFGNFVLFNKPYEQSAEDTELIDLKENREGLIHYHNFRINTVAYVDLEDNGNSSGNWGGRHLRAPDIFLELINKDADKFINLSAIADLRFGVKTGANEFFHLSQQKIKDWGIEDEYLKPVVRSLRECKSIYVNPLDLKYKILVCRKDRPSLYGSNVLEYIKWGESMGFHERPSCKGRSRWYDIGEQNPSDFIMLRFRDLRNWTPIIPSGDFIVGDTVFVGAFYNRGEVELNSAILNSTFQILVSEIYGRVNLGDGLLTTYGPEISKFPIIKHEFVSLKSPEILNMLRQLSNREVLPIFDELNMGDRRQLDEIIANCIGWSTNELDRIYSSVHELVYNRIQKAQSLKK